MITIKTSFFILNDGIFILRDDYRLLECFKENYLDEDNSYNNFYISNGEYIEKKSHIVMNKENNTIILTNPPYGLVKNNIYKYHIIDTDYIESRLEELHDVIISSYYSYMNISKSDIYEIYKTISSLFKKESKIKEIKEEDIVINESNLLDKSKIYIHLGNISIDMSIQSMNYLKLLQLELATKLLYLYKYDKAMKNIDEMDIGLDNTNPYYDRIYISNKDEFDLNDDIYIDIHKKAELSCHIAKYTLYEKYLNHIFDSIMLNL